MEGDASMEIYKIMEIIWGNMPVLEKIGSIPVFVPIRIVDLGLNRSQSLKGYRDSKKFSCELAKWGEAFRACAFKGKLVDFYCWLSTFQVAIKLSGIHKFAEGKPDYASSISECVEILFQTDRELALHSLNAVRLYLKEKKYLLNLVKALLKSDAPMGTSNALVEPYIKYMEKEIERMKAVFRRTAI